MAPRKKVPAKPLDQELQALASQAALEDADKPDGGEGSATLVADREGASAPSISVGPDDGPEGTDLMADTATVQDDTATQDDAVQDDATQDDAWTVTVTPPESDGVIPAAADALAAALQGQPEGSKADLPRLPDNDTQGGASSQGYKYRVAVQERTGLRLRAKTVRVNPKTKGPGHPHRWVLVVLPPKVDAADDTADTADDAADTQ